MKLIFKLFSYVPANSKVSLPEFNAPNEISAKDHMSLPPEDKPSNEPTRLRVDTSDANLKKKKPLATLFSLHQQKRIYEIGVLTARCWG